MIALKKMICGLLIVASLPCISYDSFDSEPRIEIMFHFADEIMINYDLHVPRDPKSITVASWLRERALNWRNYPRIEIEKIIATITNPTITNQSAIEMCFNEIEKQKKERVESIKAEKALQSKQTLKEIAAFLMGFPILCATVYLYCKAVEMAHLHRYSLYSSHSCSSCYRHHWFCDCSQRVILRVRIL